MQLASSPATVSPMIVSAAAALRRILMGLIVLAMLLQSGASLQAMTTGHPQGRGTAHVVATSSTTHHCMDKAHVQSGVMHSACCYGTLCAASAVAIAVLPVVHITWSSVYYWATDDDGAGIGHAPALGPPITLG
jgi:hypothetical protein